MVNLLQGMSPGPDTNADHVREVFNSLSPTIFNQSQPVLLLVISYQTWLLIMAESISSDNHQPSSNMRHFVTKNPYQPSAIEIYSTFCWTIVKLPGQREASNGTSVGGAATGKYGEMVKHI